MPHELDKMKMCADIYARAFAGAVSESGYVGAGQVAGRTAVRDFAKMMHAVFPSQGWNRLENA